MFSTFNDNDSFNQQGSKSKTDFHSLLKTESEQHEIDF